ncbi:MAG TPA: phosphopantetheine-binding protein [Actinophytocola sp.]|nr:phosphopantetheine-binding protein [Actinophytocola sp.]
MAEPLTPASVRADVAELLHRHPDEGSDTDDLFECGLDSLRLVALLERWRAAGVDVDFVELAERPTLASWLSLLTTRSRVAPHA